MTNRDNIKEIKARVSFISLLEKHGWEVNKEKSTRRSLTFQSGTDQIYLYPARDSDSFDDAFYTNRFTNEKGDKIQFLIHQHILTTKGPITNLNEALQYLQSLTNLPAPSFSTTVKKGPFIPFRQAKVTKDSYLIRSRQIDLEYIQSPLWHKSIFQTVKAYQTQEGLIHANIFPFMINKRLHGQELRNVDYKRFPENSNISQSIWHSALKDNTHFYIAESVIDAISFGQMMQLFSGLFISSGGSISQHQLKAIYELYNRLKGNTIYLLGDNDLAGAKFNLSIVLNLLHQRLQQHYLIQIRGAQLHVYSQMQEPYKLNSNILPSFIIDHDKDSVHELTDQIIGNFKLNMIQQIPIHKDFNDDLKASLNKTHYNKVG